MRHWFAELQYLNLLNRIINNGSAILNERTKTNCLTVLNQTISIPVDEFPLLTTRKAYWKQAICEMLCYMRGYTRLEDFHSLGVHTWDKNAEGWYQDDLDFVFLPNEETVPENAIPSVGLIYGASAETVGISYADIIYQIKNTPHDRGIIWNFWNPEYFHLGCLRPCMYSHQFNVLDGNLHLTSTMRSVDVPLGLSFNMVQAWFLAHVTAKLTGYKVASITMNLVNCHIYENQLIGVFEQVKRKPYDPPQLYFTKQITLGDIINGITKDNFNEYFELVNYKHHPPIKFPFTA